MRFRPRHGLASRPHRHPRCRCRNPARLFIRGRSHRNPHPRNLRPCRSRPHRSCPVRCRRNRRNHCPRRVRVARIESRLRHSEGAAFRAPGVGRRCRETGSFPPPLSAPGGWHKLVGHSERSEILAPGPTATARHGHYATLCRVASCQPQGMRHAGRPCDTPWRNRLGRKSTMPLPCACDTFWP